LPFRLPVINKIYIEDDSLDIRLNDKYWHIINDIDLLIKSLNFLADKKLIELDGSLLTYRYRLDYKEDFYNTFLIYAVILVISLLKNWTKI